MTTGRKRLFRLSNNEGNDCPQPHRFADGGIEIGKAVEMLRRLRSAAGNLFQFTLDLLQDIGPRDNLF